MRTGETQRSELKAEQDGLTTQNESDLTVLKEYERSFGQMEAEKKAKIANSPVMRDAERRLKSTGDMVEEWNNTYAKERVGLLPEAKYNEGMRRREEVERTVNAIRADVKRSIENFQKTEIAPIEAVQARQRKGIDELAARIKKNFAAWQKSKEKSDALEKKLRSVRSALVDECNGVTTPESLKYCSSVGWDNMRKDLPPLTEIRPPFRATENH